jgi:hypothetical protein
MKVLLVTVTSSIPVENRTLLKYQQIRNYYGGATHPLLDLGLRSIPSLIDVGSRTDIDTMMEKLQVLGTTCEGGSFVRLTMWDRFPILVRTCPLRSNTVLGNPRKKAKNTRARLRTQYIKLPVPYGPL